MVGGDRANVVGNLDRKLAGWPVTLEQTLGFLGFAVAVAGTPGPSNALLTATGAKVGVLRGLPALLGVAAGMALLMLVVTFGLGAMILGTPLLLAGLKWTGAAVLVWFAWRIATSGTGHAASEARSVGFVGAAAFQWVNPKSWLACTGAAGTYLDASRTSPALEAATLAVLFVAAALPCSLLWLVFGAAAQRMLRSERAARIFNLTMAGLLVGSVVLVLT